MSTTGELSTTERNIFTAAVGALVGAPAGPEATTAASPFLRRLPTTDRRMLSVLLRAIEYGPPLLMGRPRRFTRMEPDEREEYLRGWAESRLAVRRQGIAALKALAMLAYYGREEAWPEVGYDGPWLGRVEVPVLAAPELRPELPVPAAERPRTADERRRVAAGPHRRGGALPAGVTSGRVLRDDLELRAEACVIGTGAGGAAALARLARRGVDAVAVEAGGHPTAEDFAQRELRDLPRLYREAGLRATKDKAIGILQGRGVGGSTLHNTGLVYPPPPAITERWRREHGLPVTGRELDGYVAEVLGTLRAVPIPSERINANNDALRRGAEALGWRTHVPLHNREECCGCGYCMLGCAYNRKYNSALTYLPRAVEAGARILADAPAARIEGPAGARRVVCELVGDDGEPTGRRATIHARAVFVAAGALDSPALLLRSGLGNRRVGRGLRLHPAPLVAASFPEPVVAWRGLPQSVVLEEFASFYDDGRGGFLALPSASNWPGMIAAVLPGLGAAHRARMRAYPSLAAAAVLLHDETAGRVRAGRDGRPLASYWPGSDDRAELRRGVRALGRLYLAAGADRVHLPYADVPSVSTEAGLERALAGARAEPHRLAMNSVHPQASCPLGARRDRSAVDPRGELWGERGVFLCDTSIFPTSVGVPPQVTTMALAAAVADYAAEERL